MMIHNNFHNHSRVIIYQIPYHSCSKYTSCSLNKHSGSRIAATIHVVTNEQTKKPMSIYESNNDFQRMTEENIEFIAELSRPVIQENKGQCHLEICITSMIYDLMDARKRGEEVSASLKFNDTRYNQSDQFHRVELSRRRFSMLLGQSKPSIGNQLNDAPKLSKQKFESRQFSRIKMSRLILMLKDQ
ncbi:hypothetical protein E2986_14120 [Frieseomelitta varia]|uniref:Uncharacterized protein n=1 Tax=Frieseomelitta varia TaxID=561572 RepID=A0A833S3P8_9HYME|nr:hypothetical protein E2986_14120 [Frieseomelitta varia]